MIRSSIAIVLLAFGLSGCVSPNTTALFVTKTSLGLDVDMTPATASIAYDRKEGYLGPRYENGAVPPVIANISTNGNLLGRDVRQFYATGNAANILANHPVTAGNRVSGERMIGPSAPMFFGTETTVGIKIGFTTQVPDSFTFGYKRKEYSLIPLGSNGPANAATTEHFYPSVIGVFGTDFVTSGGAPVVNATNTTFGLTQFFATGTAAEALAGRSDIQTGFRGFADSAVTSLKEAARHQHETVLSLLRCFATVDNAAVSDVYKNAIGLKLYPAAVEGAIAAEKLPQKQRAYYIAAISSTDATSPEAFGRLEGHRVYVCENAKKI